jgi:hypothetical protein
MLGGVGAPGPVGPGLWASCVNFPCGGFYELRHQRVASILVCPQVDATSANQTSPSSRIAHVHHAMWVTFTETR